MKRTNYSFQSTPIEGKDGWYRYELGVWDPFSRQHTVMHKVSPLTTDGEVQEIEAQLWMMMLFRIAVNVPEVENEQA